MTERLQTFHLLTHQCLAAALPCVLVFYAAFYLLLKHSDVVVVLLQNGALLLFFKSRNENTELRPVQAFSFC